MNAWRLESPNFTHYAMHTCFLSEHVITITWKLHLRTNFILFPWWHVNNYDSLLKQIPQTYKWKVKQNGQPMQPRAPRIHKPPTPPPPRIFIFVLQNYLEVSSNHILWLEWLHFSTLNSLMGTTKKRPALKLKRYTIFFLFPLNQ